VTLIFVFSDSSLVAITLLLAESKPEEKETFLKTLGTDKDKKIVIYCGFVSCERSHVGATLAKEAGYKNVYRFPGGIAAWLDAGNSIDK